MSSLTEEQVWALLLAIQHSLDSAKFPKTLPPLSEEKYVAHFIRPVIEATLLKFRDLTVLGEGGRRALPVHFLGIYFFPDLAVMHYGTRLIAIEAKYIDFTHGVGDLATAIGQGAIYASAGYKASLVVTIGDCPQAIRDDVLAENNRLATVGARWRISILRIGAK